MDHTTVYTCRDILINMQYGQVCLYLLYRDELNVAKICIQIDHAGLMDKVQLFVRSL